MITNCPICHSLLETEKDQVPNRVYHLIICPKCAIEPGFRSYGFCAFYSPDKTTLRRAIVTRSDIKIISTFCPTFDFHGIATTFLKRNYAEPHHDILVLKLSYGMPLSTYQDVAKAIKFFKVGSIFQ